MIHRVDPADPAIAAALVALQRAAYAVEAALLGVPSLPPMTQTPEAFAAARLEVLAASTAGDGHEPRRPALTGFVAWRREGDTVDIHRLVVHPDHFRKGIASRLLDALDAEEAGARRFLVGTGAANAPALALYERRGFVRVAEESVGDGIPFVRLARAVPSPG